MVMVMTSQFQIGKSVVCMTPHVVAAVVIIRSLGFAMARVMVLTVIVVPVAGMVCGGVVSGVVIFVTGMMIVRLSMPVILVLRMRSSIMLAAVSVTCGFRLPAMRLFTKVTTGFPFLLSRISHCRNLVGALTERE